MKFCNPKRRAPADKSRMKKSMLQTFISRTKFEYGIPSLDKLLKTEAIPDSFLLYDEQILQILKAAGIPGPEAYATTKAIEFSGNMQ